MILRRYSLTKFLFSRYNDNADVIIWTPHINNLHYYYGDNIINDVTLFHNLFKKKINVLRCSDLNLVKNKKNKKIRNFLLINNFSSKYITIGAKNKRKVISLNSLIGKPLNK